MKAMTVMPRGLKVGAAADLARSWTRPAVTAARLKVMEEEATADIFGSFWYYGACRVWR